MSRLKIRIYREGETEPEVTISIPMGIIRIASKVVPKKALGALEEHGIELGPIVDAAQTENVSGVLVEIEEHKKARRTVISVESAKGRHD